MKLREQYSELQLERVHVADRVKAEAAEQHRVEAAKLHAARSRGPVG